jgi:hypothetical protein
VKTVILSTTLASRAMLVSHLIAIIQDAPRFPLSIWRGTVRGLLYRSSSVHSVWRPPSLSSSSLCATTAHRSSWRRGGNCAICSSLASSRVTSWLYRSWPNRVCSLVPSSELGSDLPCVSATVQSSPRRIEFQEFSIVVLKPASNGLDTLRQSHKSSFVVVCLFLFKIKNI